MVLNTITKHRYKTFLKLRHKVNKGQPVKISPINLKFLAKIIPSSTVLLAASEGEGFGLPLIEAAQHKLPIIARNLGVFHEVAGDNAFYFKASQPEHLAEAIRDWLHLYKNGQVPMSKALSWLTWEESTQQLLDAILSISK